MDKIVVFLILLYNFFVKELKFSWVRFLIATMAVLILIWYYVHCQEIFVSSNSITVDRVFGNDTLVDLKVEIRYMNNIFYSSFYEDNDSNNNFGNMANVIGIKAKADSTANIFSNEKLDSYSDSIRERYEVYKNLFIERFKSKNAENLIDNIDAVYSFGVTMTKPKYIGRIFKDIAFYTDNYLTFCDYVYEDEKVIEYSMLLGYDKEIEILGYDENILIYGLMLSENKLFSSFSPIDISKMYCEVDILDLANVKESGGISEFGIDFGSHTEFSEMYPSPDYKDVSCIKFNSQAKLNKLVHGLRFHAKITDNEVIQTTKMFIITTLMSGLLAYWVALFYNLIMSIIRALKKKVYKGSN